MRSRDEETDRLETLAGDAAKGCGVEVVDVRFQKKGLHSLLRVDIDRPGPRGVTLADCEAVSRRLDRLLDEGGILQDVPYDLQVSSPGLDRPIRSDDDFRRNTGRAVVVEVTGPDGRVEILRGVLVSASGSEIALRGPAGDDVRVDRKRVRAAVQDPRPERAVTPPRPGRKSRDPRGIV